MLQLRLTSYARRTASLVCVIAIALAAALVVLVSSARAQPSGGGDIDAFYEDLAPYGTWSHSSRYGDVWYPRDVPDDWRPYSDGRWVWTDEYGWYFESEQPWGWATFHYGRWFEHPRYGWGWIPGREWGPGWVAWRSGDDYVGWAPLPPSARLDMSVSIAPTQWVFVEQRSFNAARAYEVAVAPGRNPGIFRRTRPLVYDRVQRGRVYNRGVPVERVEAVTRAPVPRAHFEARLAADPHEFRRYEAERLRTRRVEAPPARSFVRGTRWQAPPERPQRPSERRAMPQRPNEPSMARPGDRHDEPDARARRRDDERDRHEHRAAPPPRVADPRRDEGSGRREAPPAH